MFGAIIGELNFIISNPITIPAIVLSHYLRICDLNSNANQTNFIKLQTNSTKLTVWLPAESTRIACPAALKYHVPFGHLS